MNFRFWQGSIALVLFTGLALMACGCNRAENKGGQARDQGTGAKAKPDPVADTKKDDHSGWWCDEHGVPEEVCGQCSAKAAADFKKKGDWCQEHDRPKSQCFLCDPKLKDKFAAQYRVKYGKEPPPIEPEAP
jgi:cobalt-zinc-cadmium efflux system membrane fusion protein